MRERMEWGIDEKRRFICKNIKKLLEANVSPALYIFIQASQTTIPLCGHTGQVKTLITLHFSKL
jgi:hypothetical protein